ncbi:MAG: ADP-ribosylglycohydrolase family protein [Steroidobacteraceae bacterium]
MSQNALKDRAAGCLIGSAVGDALGGPTEDRTPEEIRKRYGGWVEGIVGPYFENWRTARPLAPFHNGDGRFTDDTLMTQVLIKTYLAKRDHLDAYDIERYLVPLTKESAWIPELDAEAPIFQRLWLAEKWLALRLQFGNNDPREAGVGNIVNCGAAMYMAPVGIMNAANPAAAYAEAIDMTGAHQSSYGREAAGVFAAAVAAAMMPDASAASVVETCLQLAKDGTRAAIEAVCAAAESCERWQDAIPRLREAVAPYDTVGEDTRSPDRNARRPSRIHSIEELPVALGFLIVARGDFAGTVLGGVNYGRDSDSIAAMGGALAGALGGLACVPQAWREAVATGSRTELLAPALALAELAQEVFAADKERAQAHAAAFTTLTRSTGAT